MGENWFDVWGDGRVVSEKIPSSLTFGNFDGVHRGHQHVLSELKKVSGALPCIALTFDPHPSRFFRPNSPKPLLVPLEKRVELLIKCGADAVIVQKFDEKFANLTADRFCTDYLARYFSVRNVLIGFNLHYGVSRQGDFAHLSEMGVSLGWNAYQATPYQVGNECFSSTVIRNLLQQGDVQKAEVYLGRSYELYGIVVKGDQRGRQMGFPTANLAWKNEIIPKLGVYACLVEIEDDGVMRPAVMNCGVRPTLGGERKLQVEAHLLDFDGDLYGKKIVYKLKSYLREERKFSGLDDLSLQIRLDVEAARRVLALV